MSSVAALPFSAWPTGRKVAAGVFAVGGYIALACAAVYLAGVLFLVLSKANPKQAQFASIVHYWDMYADDTQLYDHSRVNNIEWSVAALEACLQDIVQ